MRIYKFDTIKAIAMGNVILVHAYVERIPVPHFLRSIFVAGVLGASMFLFAFISGYMIRPGRWNWNKLFRLILVAVVANFLINYIDMRLGCVYLHGYWCIAFSLWYMCVLIACKILLPIFPRPVVVLCVSVLMSWTSFLLPICLRFNPIHRFLGFVPFFALGYFVGNDKSATKIRNWLTADSEYIFIYNLLLILATMVFVFISVTPVSPYIGAAINNGLHFVHASWRMGALRIVAHMWFLMMIILWIKAIPNREMIITKFGKRTLAVYLLHAVPIFLCASFIKTHPHVTEWRYAIMTLSVLCCMLFFHKKISDFLSALINGQSPERSMR